MRSVLVLVLIVVLCRASRGAAADPPALAVDGVALAEWVKRLGAKSDDSARDAFRALTRARFLVGAGDVVIPALIAAEARGRRFGAVRALAAYGPLARSGKAVLERPAFDHESAIALVLIGEDVEQNVKRWRDHVLAQNQLYGVLNPLLSAGRLRYRGNAVPDVLLTVVQRSSFLGRGDILWLAEDLGPAAHPLREHLISVLNDPKEKEPVHKGRAALALAWCTPLDDEELKRLLRTARGVSKPFLAHIVRALAVVRRPPSEAIEEFLRSKLGDGDPRVATWAAAGLARKVPADAPLPQLIKALRHADFDVRAAAAAGLLALGPETPGVLDAVKPALEDVDTRVRWRAVAVLALSKEPPSDLSEIRRAIDGPDDEDRVLVFEALQHIGPRASALADAVEPWTKMPFPLLAQPAQRALEALREPPPQPR